MISVVIPHWPKEPIHDELLKKCVKSLEGQYDELLVIVNDGTGFGKAVNKGLELASGDWIVVVNNDTELASGNLGDLCGEEVTYGGTQFGAFFCLPRAVYEQIGGFDEQFEIGYWEDDDLLKRLEDADIPVTQVTKVQVNHVGGATMYTIENREQIMKQNQIKFQEKWPE